MVQTDPVAEQVVEVGAWARSHLWHCPDSTDMASSDMTTQLQSDTTDLSTTNMAGPTRADPWARWIVAAETQPQDSDRVTATPVTVSNEADPEISSDLEQLALVTLVGAQTDWNSTATAAEDSTQ